MFFEEYWWIFPLIMIGICFLIMRGKGSMCGCGSHGEHSPDSPKEILDRRYANGEIEKTEYEEKKRAIN
jgi:putative membrane protein